MWMTAIILPDTSEPIQDSAGFTTHKKTYTDPIPANRMDPTYRDDELANQWGYTTSYVYEIDAAAYNGAGYLIDLADGCEYEIKDRFQKDRSKWIRLTVQRREHGKR